MLTHFLKLGGKTCITWIQIEIIGKVPRPVTEGPCTKPLVFGDYDIKEKPHIGVANTFLKDLPEQVISGNLQITLRTESGQQVACP